MNRLAQQIYLALSVLLLLTLAPIGVFWGISNAIDRELARSTAANEVLQNYQMLRIEGAKINNLAIAAGGDDDPAVQDQLKAIDKYAARIRVLISSEIALIGEAGIEEESEEFEILESIIDEIHYISESKNYSASWDMTLEDAIAHETAEIVRIDEIRAQYFANIKYFVILFFAVNWFLIASCAAWLRSQIVKPIVKVLQGMQHLIHGDRNYRIKPSGLATMKTTHRIFNQLAENLMKVEEATAKNQNTLEAAVASQTAQLVQANTELLRQSERRTQFLADISHELRTPLAIIGGETDVALRNAGASIVEHRDSLARVRSKAQDMTRLVDDLLFMARNDAGAAATQHKWVDLVPLLRTLTNSLQPLLAADDGKLQFCPEVGSAQILGDEGRLRQLLTILLDNAIHYSEGPPEIVVSLTLLRDSCMISVQDKGSGIAPSELPYVFERFRRGSRGIEQNVGGSGLGLPLAKAIAESHGGSITIESVIGVGTKVVILLAEDAKVGDRR